MIKYFLQFITIVLLFATNSVKSEDGTWVFLESTPEDITNGNTSVVRTISVPFVLNNELLFEKSYTINGTIFAEFLSSDGSVINTNIVIDNADAYRGLNSQLNTKIIDNNIIYIGPDKTLMSWGGTSQIPIILTPVDVDVFDILQCDPDPNFGEQVYLRASTLDFGKELWVSNGAAVNTYMVHDIALGATNSISPLTTGRVICSESDLLFEADDGVHGEEIWKADRNGAVLLRDSLPGSDDGFISELKVSVNNNVPVYIGYTPCFSSDPCNNDSIDHPFGFRSGVLRTTLDGGLSPFKFSVPENIQGGIKDFREFQDNGNYSFSSSKIFKNGVEIMTGISFRHIVDFPDYSILRPNGIGKSDIAFLIEPTTITAIPSNPIVELNYNIQPFNNGHVFIAASQDTSVQQHIWFSDGTANGIIELTERSSPIYTIFGNSIYFKLYSDNKLMRYGPAENPEIGYLGTITINEDSSLNSNLKHFIVGGSVVAFADLITSAESLDTTMLLDSNLIINGTRQLRDIKLQPSPDQYGNFNIKLTVTDHRGWTDNTTIPVTILAINDKPSFDIPSDLAIPSGVAQTFNIPNFIQNINFGPNEDGQMVSEYIISESSDNISNFTVNTDGDLTFTTDGEVFDTFVYITMRDNGGTERNGIDLSDSPRIDIHSNPAIDVGVTGTYLGLSNGSHLFEYTITNTNPTESLSQSNMSIITTATMLNNAVTTCMTTCSETINGLQTQMNFSLASDSSAIIRVSGEFDIDSNPGVVFSSFLQAIVENEQVDDNLNNNSVSFELPQIIFTNGFE